MNKKFLSAVLFGALMVSSTGLFVSCKDYDDDIDKLQEQIDKLVTPETLNTQIAQLQANIDAAKQSASSELATAKAALEAAIAGKADATVVANLTEKVEAAQAKVDNLDNKFGTIESSLNAVKSDVDNLKQNAGKAEMAEIDRRIKELRTELLAIIGDKLSSLVFVPSLYENGIEATRYPYALGIYKAFTGNAIGENYEEADFTIDEKNTFIDVATDGGYAIGSLAKAYYHVNPTTANLTNVAWGFLYSEPEYVDASSRAGVDAPKPVYSAHQMVNGDLEVVYKVENPAGLKVVADKNVSVMALTGTYQNEEAKDTTVTSDYAAILPAVVSFKAIAFTTFETENAACALGNKKHELYIKGEDAAKKVATIDVKYNGGTFDLSQYLNVHYTQADIKAAADDAEHQIMAYADVANYGLHFEYEMLGYKTGANKTEENKYGTIDNNGIFTPCYVNANGATTPCSTSETAGISAVGRTPIVLVKLMDGANVVLAGYVKLHIVKDLGIQTLPEVFNATKPYVCDGFEDAITWDDMSGKIIEALKMTKAEFVNSFTFVSGKTYIGSNNAYVEVENNKYGTLTISEDFVNVSTTNDIITWKANFDQMDAISKLANRTVTLYACFQSKTDTKFFVYVPFTVTIAAQPEVTFGDKIKAYWYPTSEATVAKRDTIRMNVPRPTTDDDKTVENYSKDLDDNFEGNVVKITKTTATQNQYYDLTTLGTAYSYEFAAEQPEIVDPNDAAVKYQLVRGANPTELYVGTELVASIDANGTLTYATTPSAKKLLNLYGHLVPKHFANVDIVATYGECKLALGTESFKVRFLRPVDVLDGDQAKFIDAQANGSSIVLGDLFDLKDWREEALLVKNAAGAYKSAEENGVELYPYYKFETIKVDIDNAECDLTGTRKKVSEVTNKLELSVTGTGVQDNVVDITTVDALNTTKIVYKNNEGNVQKFTLWIPVEITYYWGTLKAVAKCDVESTKANQ
ncbi:MAG: hypothetical protein K2G02_02500 [Phocaeicola sp.]|uniref:hypothetical protein n=1 Tax=Phocaeicola sp. TaxID=2773926 RepID=UPI0023D552A6|nr:hypothetical protein [Phocaeicola sp.]MDE5677402.1 hypothetical protein [Phocaeicola sp.]MDE6179997.1 hypothetical protein [Phocaeicola sp.]